MYRLLLPLLCIASISCPPVERDYVAWQNPDLFEGDILLPHDLQDRNSQINLKLWVNGIIPYEIAPDLKKYEKDIKKMMDYIKKATNDYVHFEERKSIYEDYVYIQNGPGCSSSVGVAGGKQTLSLEAPVCLNPGLMLHELTHTIGFWHEHSRFDRDDHINILWENIQDRFKDEFFKLNEYEARIYDMFDYDSIMMIDDNSFSKDMATLKTMTPKKEGAVILGLQKRSEFSESDIYRIKQMYEYM